MLLLQHEDSRREFYEPGTWTSGSLLATVLPGVRLSERDKVRLLDLTDTYTDETLARGVDDTLRFQYGVHVLVVADLLRSYQAGVDYVLTPPATITWLLPMDQGPPFTGQYAVKYEAQPEFLVVSDSPRLRSEHRTPQAQEVVLQRLDRLDRDAPP